MQKAKVMIDETTQKNIDSWLTGEYDEASKREIRRLEQENPEELLDAFFTHLSFGTGGIRGILGVGTNRINPYTIGAATQGLANYLLKQGGKHSVLVNFDSRHHSRDYAEEVAKVLAANEIKVYLFRELRPVASISFGVRHLKCSAGVMITASHNPPKYNGYKVYWSDGGQVLPPHDKGIIEEVGKITKPSMVKKTVYPHPLIHDVSDEVDTPYLRAIKELEPHPGEDLSHGSELAIVYSPIHGGGITMVPRALEEWGFTNLALVKEQCTPSGDFPTVKVPNPEEPETLKLGISLLQKRKADIFIATDPDADRLAITVMHEGKPISLNGNEIACVALEHLCRSLTETKQMPPKPMAVKTIVTTELFKAIAEHYNVSCLDVLTGFKYIGQKISQWEEEKLAHIQSHHFLFGAEESYGFLYGTHARDKDAVIVSALLCEAALHMKLQNKTLVDLLYDIYQKHGLYRERLLSLSFERKEGIDLTKQTMQSLREKPPFAIGGIIVTSIEDYLTHTAYTPETGQKEPLLLPKSDVLRFWLSDGTKIVVRPSGTEPKIKLYCGCQEKHSFTDRKALEKAIVHCDRKTEEYLLAFKHLLHL